MCPGCNTFRSSSAHQLFNSEPRSLLGGTNPGRIQRAVFTNLIFQERPI